HFEFTIGRMTGGGIYDQLGGGLCRYAVDDAWQIPHFEKMLYDNALLIWTLAAGHRRNPSTRYVQLLQQTFDFLQRELKGAEGGYCAGLDADSGGREGGYYLWSWQEAEQLLGEQSAPVLDYFGLQPEGNWEGANILHRARTDEEIGKRFDLSADRWASIREKARDVLLAFRQKRPAPRRDDKVLLSWNALLVSALANAFQATGEERYRREAGELYEFLLDRFWHGQAFPLRHSYLEGKARFRAFLDDYALLIRASLDLYGINFDLDLLQRAGQLTD
ncbi:MAG: thioredoxin domain-containing protein, partial [Saprospiraceae bacterium]|nr:thioredoxin domain-containing protein [Saprospiraceae bacterium]